METLLKPDLGLMIWTIVTFSIMVAILKKVAWGPLLKVLEEREEKIRQDVEAAEKNRAQMEQFKADYERQLGEIETRAKSLLAQAEKKGLENREAILKDAQDQARKIQEKTRQELEIEKEKISRELRCELGELSVKIAEKIVRKTIDKKVQEDALQDFLKNLK